MKRYLFFFLILVFTSFSYAGIQVSDSRNPHNLAYNSAHIPGSYPPKSAAIADGGTDQICIFCHTPHSAAAKSTLWNRPDPDGPVGGFPLYAQALLIKNDPATTGYNTAMQYPNGASRMCLSCHDGVTAIGILLGNQTIAMGAGDTKITNPSAVINLATSHPISFVYNDKVVGPILSSAAYQQPPSNVDTPLDGLDRMQCTTCHDPHVNTRGDATILLPFWRHDGGDSATSYSEVCASCHQAPTTGTAPPVHNINP